MTTDTLSPAPAWQWTAYMDGAEPIREADDHPFGEVWQGTCYALECTPTRGGPAFSLQLAPGERPVFFRQRASPFLNAGGEWRTIHCLGRELPDGTGHYVFWDDEGHVVISGDRRMLDRLA